MIQPIVLAGGSGSRLWPLSRELYPKQFMTISDGLSMLQQTFFRLKGLKHNPPIVVCNEEHRFIAAEQIRTAGLSHSGIILEPFGRNTSPAIALAALQFMKQGEDSVLLVLAADHLIENIAAFEKSVEQGISYAEADRLVTFGITPVSPEIGYGYIRKGEAHNFGENGYEVDCFFEKPDLETAKSYIEADDYYWNSGMFMFKASQYLSELKRLQPDIFESCEKALLNSDNDMDFVRVDRVAFDACSDISIDHAVMEKTRNATVIPMDAGWSDVGSWSALWDVSKKDENNNVVKGDVFTVDSSNNYIHADSKFLATIGVNNSVIIETKDAILVADKSQVQDVKSIVNYLKLHRRPEYKTHREVYRPWGKYDLVDFGKRDQVKRITVNPGEKLSIQMHHHRAEHWVVVSGTAKVKNGDHEILLTENESTYIPVGVVHALENPGKIPLELIEVQSGSYLGEDDIVRFSDRYGR